MCLFIHMCAQVRFTFSFQCCISLFCHFKLDLYTNTKLIAVCSFSVLLQTITVCNERCSLEWRLKAIWVKVAKALSFMYKIKKKTSFIYVVLKKPVHLMSTFFMSRLMAGGFHQALKFLNLKCANALLFPHVCCCMYVLFKWNVTSCVLFSLSAIRVEPHPRISHRTPETNPPAGVTSCQGGAGENTGE